MIRLLNRVVLLVATGLVLTGCAPDAVSAQYRQGTNQDYIAGDGTFEVYAAANRSDPVPFGGTTETGDPITSEDLAGSVVVLNFWYASCPPCRAEAPDLEKLNQQFADDGVAFLGVNVRDEAATAASFAETFGVTYPSIIDSGDAGVQLAFSGAVPPNAVPTTLVLDREGRIAARFLGQVLSLSTLEAVIGDAVTEKS